MVHDLCNAQRRHADRIRGRDWTGPGAGDRRIIRRAGEVAVVGIISARYQAHVAGDGDWATVSLRVTGNHAVQGAGIRTVERVIDCRAHLPRSIPDTHRGAARDHASRGQHRRVEQIRVDKIEVLEMPALLEIDFSLVSSIKDVRVRRPRYPCIENGPAARARIGGAIAAPASYFAHFGLSDFVGQRINQRLHAVIREHRLP